MGVVDGVDGLGEARLFISRVMLRYVVLIVVVNSVGWFACS
jgi:hypothetical protein